VSNPSKQRRNHMNKPQELSIAEWKELMQLSVVRESWGIQDNETPEQFADIAYGVKFKFSPVTAPGYCGDIYILSGDALGEPMTFIREDGNLVLVG
jgi:hypothetical protein